MATLVEQYNTRIKGDALRGERGEANAMGFLAFDCILYHNSFGIEVFYLQVLVYLPYVWKTNK